MLRTDLEQLPTTPGVYLMKGAKGEILYIGKAVDLRSRVKQYFVREGDGRFHVLFLRRKVRDVEVMLTDTEREALLLESALIKKHQPRYNVRLKDDKNWASLRLDPKAFWPRLRLVRQRKADGARYFGPYLHGLSARKVDRMVRSVFPLRTCSDATLRAHKQRACIEYNIGNCAGPCAGHIDQAGYSELVEQASALLAGRSQSLRRELSDQMRAHADKLEFEQAARLRDRVEALTRMSERQRVWGEGSRDVFGVCREGERGVVLLLPQRGGRMQEATAWRLEQEVSSEEALLREVLLQLYDQGLNAPPGEILLPCTLPDQELIQEWLSDIAGRKVQLLVPQRGDKKALIEMARKNAANRLTAAWDKRERGLAQMQRLQRVLRREEPPRRLECYDMSNIQGTDPVGSMVTFQDGLPWKSGYRIFKIKTVVGADDFASMKEVLSRRLQRAGQKGWELPDIFVIDGGRGQLRMACEAARELGYEGLSFLALAKPKNRGRNAPLAPDRIFLPGRSNPIVLRAGDPGLLLLQAIRDEAHRFGVHHHRKQRRKRTLTSELDSVPGLGPARRTALLQHFGSVKAVASASLAELVAVQGVGERLARDIRSYFDNLALTEVLVSGDVPTVE